MVRIKDIMERPVFIPPDATKKEIFRIAKKHEKTEIFIVAGKDGKFLGDIDENDIFLMMIPNELYEDIGVELGFDLERKFFAGTAKDLMRKHDVTCTEDEKVMDVALRLAREEVNEMPVLDRKGHVVGVINEGHLLRYLK